MNICGVKNYGDMLCNVIRGRFVRVSLKTSATKWTALYVCVYAPCKTLGPTLCRIRTHTARSDIEVKLIKMRSSAAARG